MPRSPDLQPTPDPSGDAWLAAAASVAIAAPVLLAYNVPPSATFLNQALAFIGWGVLLLLLAFTADIPRLRPSRGSAALLTALLLLALATFGAWQFFGLPAPLALSSLGTIAAAIVAAWGGIGAAQSPRAQAVFQAVCVAL